MFNGKGRCLCGAVRYKFDPEALIWSGHCHCKSCRRACSAPVVSWFGVRLSAWRWAGTSPQRYRSSPHATRFFCPGCGSQMGYRTTKLPDEIHGLAMTLETPEAFAPQAHFYHAQRIDWLHLADALPRYVDGGKTLET
ncbi:MAG: GFA family protein [Rhodobacter sp.]|nr:GFA family protein [Rhodobacter sp.]